MANDVLLINATVRTLDFAQAETDAGVIHDGQICRTGAAVFGSG